MANKIQDAIVSASRTLGMANGAFIKAKEQMLRRPDFVAGMAQESQWNGGQLGLNTEAAQRRAARNSWFYAGVNKKALDLSGSKLDIYNNPSGLEDDGVKAEAHPFYNTLRRPNPYMGKSLLMQYTQWWMDLSGEAFWFMNPEPGGIKELWAIPSNKMDMEFTPDGKKLKCYIAKLHQWYRIDPAYIIHFKYPNPWDFFRGLPPLIAFMLTVDADLAMKMWNGAFFGKDNVMPSAIISIGTGDPNNMFEQKDVDAVRDELKNEYGAIQRKTVVTNANSMSAALLGYNAKDMDFLAGMQWNKEEILIALGVPPGLLDKNATEANAKVGNVVFKEYMWGTKCLIADEITVQCLQVFYNENLEARFEDDRIRDRAAELQEAQIAKDAMTREEWAKKYFNVDLQPGDVTMNEGRMQQAAEASKQQDSQTDKPTDEKPKEEAKQEPPASDSGQKNDEPDDKKSMQVDFDALFIKARNFWKQGKLQKLSFASELLDGEVLKSIVSDLQAAEQQADIGFIKDHWAGVLFDEAGNTQENLKGGAGSGNFGHAGRPGEVGGSSSETSHHTEGKGTSKILSDVKGWDDPERRAIALGTMTSRSKNDISVLKVDGEVVGVVGFRPDRLVFEQAGVPKGKYTYIDGIATKRAGYGRQTMQIAIDRAKEKNEGLLLHANEAPVDFYKHIGMNQSKKNEKVFFWTAKEIQKLGSLKSVELKAILSWRPWSMFEQQLKNAVLLALQKILQIFLDNAAQTLTEDGGVWTQVANTFHAEIQPTLFDVAEKAVKDTYKILSASSITTSFDVTNQLAREWTMVYAGDQIRGIDETTKKAVRKTIDEWIESGRGDGISGLQDRLEAMTDENGVPLFGEQRAERIAQSEITSIYAGATERALTSNEYPPAVYKPRAHVNCRCYLQPGRMASGEKVIVWYTARDERVCIQPLDTPFGQVAGCKELHRTIVSEGRAGEKWEGNTWNPSS